MNYSGDMLLFFGFALLTGVMADHFFRRIRLSATAGYLFAGILLGATGFGMVGHGIVGDLKHFMILAMGMLGFMAGTTVKYKTLSRYGSGLLILGLGGGMIASLITGTVMFLLLAQGSPEDEAIRAACLLAPLAAGIGPWTIRNAVGEAKARGTVSAALNSVADLGFLPLVVMYGLAEVVLLFREYGWSGGFAGQVALKLGGAVLFGVFFGILLQPALKLAAGPRKAAVMILSMITLCASLAALAGMDIVLTVFMMGAAAVNFRPSAAEPEGLSLMKDIHLPFYMILLVAVMGEIDLFGISTAGCWLVVGFAVCCCAARGAGIWLAGAAFEKSRRIRSFLCLGVFGQSAFTVVLVLSAAAGARQPEIVLDIAVLGVLILQLAGPLCTRLSLKLAGESGRNIADGDLMKKMTAGDVMIRNYDFIHENEPVNRVLERFSSGGRQVYPVVTDDNELVGILNFESLRGILANHDSWQWLVAADLMMPASDRVMVGDPLTGVCRKLEAMKGVQIPVMDDENNYKLVGMLDLNTIRMKVHSEILCRNHHHKG